MTSESYAIDEIGGVTGADAKCAALAEAAGLPGTFVAWLSDSETDAIDRLAGARGFYNMRFQAFADEVSDIVSGRIYFPIRYDENGDPVSGRVATGTTHYGAAADTCLDWESTEETGLLQVGDPTRAAVFWTEDFGGGHCDESFHLYCFQIDEYFPTYPTLTQGRTVFVSSATFVPGPEGRDAADALCAADAAAENLDGTFVALLGTSSESPLARLTVPGRPWVRPDGMVVADDTAEVLAGPLATPIDMLANGVYLAGVLTYGATTLDQSVALNCDDWTSPDATPGSVTKGVVGYTDQRWYAAQSGACGDGARVVCAQQ